MYQPASILSLCLSLLFVCLSLSSTGLLTKTGLTIFSGVTINPTATSLTVGTDATTYSHLKSEIQKEAIWPGQMLTAISPSVRQFNNTLTWSRKCWEQCRSVAPWRPWVHPLSLMWWCSKQGQDQAVCVARWLWPWLGSHAPSTDPETGDPCWGPPCTEALTAWSEGSVSITDRGKSMLFSSG